MGVGGFVNAMWQARLPALMPAPLLAAAPLAADASSPKCSSRVLLLFALIVSKKRTTAPGKLTLTKMKLYIYIYIYMFMYIHT